MTPSTEEGLQTRVTIAFSGGQEYVIRRAGITEFRVGISSPEVKANGPFWSANHPPHTVPT
jgi:hypothetical protein